MIKIEIKPPDINDKHMRSKTGKESLIREQMGWAHLGKDYPHELRVSIEDGKSAYPPEDYTIDPTCLYVDRFGRLTLWRHRLNRT